MEHATWTAVVHSGKLAGMPGTTTTLAPSRLRSAGIDFVRLVGIVAVVAGHSFTGDVVQRGIYTWHVPLFFFLSGYLWKPGRPLAREWAGRVRTLAVPYVAWLVLITVVTLPLLVADQGLRAGERRGAVVALGGTYLKSPYQAFWFVSALLFACLLYRGLERVWPWSPLWLAGPLLAVGAFAEPLRWVPLSLGVAVPAVFFLIAGQVVRGGPNWVRHPVTAVAVLVVAAVLTVTGVNEPLDVKYGDFGTPVLSMVVAAGICAALTILAEAGISRLVRAVQNRVLAVASIGLVVVLTHGVPIYYLWGRVDHLALFLIAVAFGCACGWLALRSPGSRALLGR